MASWGERRALIMVWDGLRPDYVTPELTPRLNALAGAGTWFADSHAVVPTVTRCNSASIATGALPVQHGIPGNRFVIEEQAGRGVFNAADHEHLAHLGRARGAILLTGTLGDAIAAAGGRSAVLGTGSPGAALLQHPRAAECGDLMLHPVMWHGIEPAALPDGLGSPPNRTRPNTEQNDHFTRLITEVLLPEYQPRLVTYWHTDPDHTQHALGVGHPETLRALRDADANLGAILDALDRLGLAGETDVVVTSDHGFSTIIEPLPLVEVLLEAGVKRDEASEDVIVADGMVYVHDHDPELTRRVVEVLGRTAGVGAMFTGSHGQSVVPGSADLAVIGHGGDICPDVLVSGAWSAATNEHGYAGACAAGNGATEGYRATHGSMSPWDIQNTLILAGPSFRSGAVSEAPAGNMDIAPTLRHTLGLPPSAGAGRVLAEALSDGPEPETLEPHREVIETRTADGTRRQRVHRSHVGDAVYIDYAEAERG